MFKFLKNLFYRRYVQITYNYGDKTYSLTERRYIVFCHKHDYDGEVIQRMYIPINDLFRIQKEIQFMAGHETIN